MVIFRHDSLNLSSEISSSTTLKRLKTRHKFPNPFIILRIIDGLSLQKIISIPFKHQMTDHLQVFFMGVNVQIDKIH